jgi:hypothetical protein
MSREVKRKRAMSLAGHDVNGGRPELDFYPTPPEATQALLDMYEFRLGIWEPACGNGAISKVLIENGYNVVSSDIQDYGYPFIEMDFLKCEPKHLAPNIVTNPPFKLGEEFVRKALDVVMPGGYVCILHKLQFLEGQKRKALFQEHPPSTVHVFSKRLSLSRDGKPQKNGGMMAFAWYVWKVGHIGLTNIDWI